jgi:hypothetical protein
VARADLGDALRGGLLGVAVGEALGLPWAGVSPRAIKRDRLLEGVGPTGAATAAVLGGPPNLASALAVGWRHRDDAAARRSGALPLGFAAVVVADLAATTLAGRTVHQLVTDHADDWPPPFHGVAADDRSVADALLAVLQRHDDPSEGMRAAVRLGGGGAPLIGALVGGILGCRRPSAIDRVPWRDRVALPDEQALDAAITALR